jgi:hypothetical protein
MKLIEKSDLRTRQIPVIIPAMIGEVKMDAALVAEHMEQDAADSLGH